MLGSTTAMYRSGSLESFGLVLVTLSGYINTLPSPCPTESHSHNVGISRNPNDDCGNASKAQCKCTCRRGSGPSAPARARFMGLIGCTRVLCRAVSWSSGMPDDNSEARALCACRQCSRAAGSQQSSRARRELSQRAALRPRPAWPAPPPSWPLLAVCAAAHMQARGALRTLAPIQCLPPCLYAFRRGARDDARGSSRSSSCWSRASSSHSFHGAWATDAMATRRWNSGGAILPGSDADARVDVGGVGGLAR